MEENERKHPLEAEERSGWRGLLGYEGEERRESGGKGEERT